MNSFENAALDIVRQWTEAIEHGIMMAKPSNVKYIRQFPQEALPEAMMKVALIGGQDRLLMEITGKFVHEDGGIFFKIDIRDAQNDHGEGKTPEQKRNERKAERRRIDDAK